MAALTPAPDQAADILQKLSLDSQASTLEIPEPTKKPSSNQFGSVDSGNTANGQIPLNGRSMSPVLPDFVDSSICYVPNGYHPAQYYYGGFDGNANEWGDDYSRYGNPDGVDITSRVYGDDGSFMYHHGYGYASYGPYSPATSPVPTLGNDGQLYGPQQHYQYPPYFQPLTATSGPYTLIPATIPPPGEVSASAAAKQKPLSVEGTNGKTDITNGGGFKGNNGVAPFKPTYQNSLFNSNGSFGKGSMPGRIPASSYQYPRQGFDGMQSSMPWIDAPVFPNGQPRPVNGSTIPSVSNDSSRQQNYRSSPHYMGLHHSRPTSGMAAAQGLANQMYPNKVYGQYGNRSNMGFGANVYDSQRMGIDRYRYRGRVSGCFGYGNDNMNGLNELNRGPRAKGYKNQKGSAPMELAVKGQSVPMNETTEEEKDKISLASDREQFNQADFPEEYNDAKFFVIKSYSEDDVHKSIKYSVWASTPNGNKKLDAAYQEARQKSGGCPVFLFFSVNTSGQFVGLAEMVGAVDFLKDVEYWQQNKWIGSFPVKWHIVKDVPNNLLKHVTLENNENKPVTNSRDTQEVKLEKGLEMIKIFKNHSSKTCILDDFEFYEGRQKAMQENKAKQQQHQKQGTAQVWEGKPTNEKRDSANGEVKSVKLSDVASDLTKESSSTTQVNGDIKISENGSVANSVTVSDKIVANGVANVVPNGCL